MEQVPGPPSNTHALESAALVAVTAYCGECAFMCVMAFMRPTILAPKLSRAMSVCPSVACPWSGAPVWTAAL